MIRVVADVNVLVSAALARSPDAPSVLTLDATLDGRIEPVTSPALLHEIATVLARPRLQKYVSPADALRFVADLVFATRSGRPLGQRNVARALRAVQKQAVTPEGSFPESKDLGAGDAPDGRRQLTSSRGREFSIHSVAQDRDRTVTRNG